MAKRKTGKGKVDWRLPRMVLARKNMAREVIAALEVHGDAIAEGIEARLVPLLGDREPMTDVRHFLNLLCRDLERLHGDLEGASDSHGDQLIDAKRRRKDLRSARPGVGVLRLSALSVDDRATTFSARRERPVNGGPWLAVGAAR